MELQDLLLNKWTDGLITRVPDNRVPLTGFSASENIELNGKYLPTKPKGHFKYNASGISSNPIRGFFVYKHSDGTKQYIASCGGKLYYSVAGSGTWSAYQIGGADLTITSDADCEFAQYNDAVYMVSGNYPIITNTDAYTLIEDCDDAWTSGDADSTVTLDTGDKQVGSGSAKFVVGAGISDLDLLGYENITSIDLSDINYIKLWIKSLETVASGDLQILIDDTAACVSPVNSVDVPELVADTWTEVSIAITPGAGSDATISVGLKYTANSKANTIRLDSIRGMGNYTTSKILKISGTTPSEITEANAPQGAKYIIVHQERLFLACSNDELNGLYWSEAQSPEDFTPSAGSNFDYVGKDDGEIITGLISYQDFVFTGKPSNIYRYSTLGDITLWSWTRLDTDKGWLYQRTVQEFQGQLIYLSRRGVCMSDGNSAWYISDNIRPDILALPQLVDNSRQWLQTTTTDFDTGTVGDGIDTSDNQLKQLPQTSKADFDAGTKTYIDTASESGKFNCQQNRGVYGRNIAYEVLLSATMAGITSTNIFDGDDDTYETATPGGGGWWQDVVVRVPINRTINRNYIKYYIPSPGSAVTATLSRQVDNGAWVKIDDWGVTLDTVETVTTPFSPVTTGVLFFTNVRIRFQTDGDIPRTGIKIYLFDVLSPYTAGESNLASQALDLAFTPTSMGHVACTVDTPTDTAIVIQTNTSADDVTYDGWLDIGSAGENGGAINSTARRYMKIKVKMTVDSAGENTPTVSDIYFGATFKSVVKDLGSVPASWGQFVSDYSGGGETLVFRMRSGSSAGNCAAATWYTQTPGVTIVTVALAQFVQVEVRYSTTDTTNIPLSNSFRINYFTGANLITPCSISWKDGYWLNVADEGSSTNDVVFKYHKDKYWLKRINKKNNVYAIDEDKLLSGTSASDGFVRENDTGGQDDTTDIDSWFETPNIKLADAINVLRYIYISSIADADWTLSYSLDGGAYTDITVSAKSTDAMVKKIMTGIVRCTYIKFKFRQNSEDVNWQIHGIRPVYQILRELTVE